MITGSGDAYLANAAIAAAAHELGRLDTPPCALRILAGDDTFDADYVRMLSEVTNAELAGEPVPGGGGDIDLRVLDEELATIDPDGATWQITGQMAWRWASWNVETDAITMIDALEPGTSDVVWFSVDDHVYGAQTDADYTETKLVELLDGGKVDARLTGPGFMFGLAKIR